MTTNNSEIEAERLDVGHELPAGQDGADEIRNAEQRGITAAEAAPASADLETAEAERKALQDQLALLQAEFGNSRTRAACEQLELKEFAPRPGGCCRGLR